MNKPDRKNLFLRIVRLANLPPGRGTKGYLTRRQLIELVLYLEGTQELLNKYKILCVTSGERVVHNNESKKT